MWPLTLRAQQSKSKPMRRVAALMPYSANDPQGQNRNAAFLQALQQLGWTVGQNVQIDYRWSAGSEDDTRKYARNWWRLRRTSSSLRARMSSHYGRRPAPCRSCSCSYQILLAQVSSTVWPDRAANRAACTLPCRNSCACHELFRWEAKVTLSWLLSAS